MLVVAVAIGAQAMLASAQPVSGSGDLSDLAAFINRAGGFWSDRIILQQTPDMGRGVFAKQALPSNYVFLKVPLTSLITPALVVHEIPKMKPVSDIDALANYIQVQNIKGAASRFHAYSAFPVLAALLF